VKKKIFIGLGILIVVLGLVVGGLYYFKDNNNKDNTPALTDKDNTQIVLKINPAVMISIDKNGKVIGVTALNKDAEIFSQLDFTNYSIEEAIDKIISVATQHDYLTDNKEISLVLISGSNQKYLEQAKNTVISKGIDVVELVLTEEEKTDFINILDKEEEDKSKDLRWCVFFDVKVTTDECNKLHDDLNEEEKKYRECSANKDIYQCIADFNRRLEKASPEEKDRMMAKYKIFFDKYNDPINIKNRE